MCAVMEKQKRGYRGSGRAGGLCEASDKPRFPKLSQIRYHQRVYEGAKPKPRTSYQVSVYRSVGPWIPPTRAERGEAGRRRGGEERLPPVCLPVCVQGVGCPSPSESPATVRRL